MKTEEVNPVDKKYDLVKIAFPFGGERKSVNKE